MEDARLAGSRNLARCPNPTAKRPAVKRWVSHRKQVAVLGRIVTDKTNLIITNKDTLSTREMNTQENKATYKTEVTEYILYTYPDTEEFSYNVNVFSKREDAVSSGYSSNAKSFEVQMKYTLTEYKKNKRPKVSVITYITDREVLKIASWLKH